MKRLFTRPAEILFPEKMSVRIKIRVLCVGAIAALALVALLGIAGLMAETRFNNLREDYEERADMLYGMRTRHLDLCMELYALLSRRGEPDFAGLIKAETARRKNLLAVTQTDWELFRKMSVAADGDSFETLGEAYAMWLSAQRIADEYLLACAEAPGLNRRAVLIDDLAIMLAETSEQIHMFEHELSRAAEKLEAASGRVSAAALNVGYVMTVVIAALSIIIALIFAFSVRYITDAVTLPLKNAANETAALTDSDKYSPPQYDAYGGGGLAYIMRVLHGEVREKRSAMHTAEMKSAFLSRMSHELRTPLNSIIGMSELAAMERMSPKVAEYVSDIRTAGYTMLSLIEDFPDLSGIESGEFSLSEKPYAVASVIFDALAITRARVREDVEFISEIDENIPESLSGDHKRVKQVMLNLLLNAAENTERGFVKVSMTCELRGSAARVYVTVTDSGRGMGAEDLAEVFGEADELRAPGTRRVGYAGLGLAVARGLCRAMGGDIVAESELGKGSEFRAEFNQTIESFAPLGKLAAAAPRETAEMPRFDPDKYAVLVVDDVPANLKVAKALLTRCGIKPDLCESGAEALKMVQARDYDLVLMDHMMPDMDGVETVKKIRELPDPKFADLRISALTANAVAGTREMFFENGFNDYISKPVEPDKLARLLRRHDPETRGETPSGAKTAVTELNIRGLNAAEGLRRAGGNEEAYTESLKEFLKEAKDVREQIEAGRRFSNRTLIALSVRAVTEAAERVSAFGIGNAAEELNFAVKNEGDESLDAAAARFLKELGEMTDAMEGALSR